MFRFMLSVCLVSWISHSEMVAGLLAQSPSTISNGLTVAAVATHPVKPERLRLIMICKAQGADAKSAIVLLNEHKERVKKELDAMKADKESVAFSNAQLTGAEDENSVRMMQMRAMRNPANENKPAMPKVYTASCVVKAEWPLPVSEGDALALLPVTLTEQIKARDLAGDKNKPKLSKADQEQLEELEAATQEQYGYSQDAQVQRIEFIGRIDDSARMATVKSAHDTAIKQADWMASGIGLKRGKLIGVTSSINGSELEQTMLANSYAYSRAFSGANMPLLDKFPLSADWVAGDQPDSLLLTVSLVLNFSLD